MPLLWEALDYSLRKFGQVLRIRISSLAWQTCCKSIHSGVFTSIYPYKTPLVVCIMCKPSTRRCEILARTGDKHFYSSFLFLFISSYWLSPSAFAVNRHIQKHPPGMHCVYKALVSIGCLMLSVSFLFLCLGVEQTCDLLHSAFRSPKPAVHLMNVLANMPSGLLSVIRAQKCVWFSSL